MLQGTMGPQPPPATAGCAFPALRETCSESSEAVGGADACAWQYCCPKAWSNGAYGANMKFGGSSNNALGMSKMYCGTGFDPSVDRATWGKSGDACTNAGGIWHVAPGIGWKCYNPALMPGWKDLKCPNGWEMQGTPTSNNDIHGTFIISFSIDNYSNMIISLSQVVVWMTASRRTSLSTPPSPNVPPRASPAPAARPSPTRPWTVMRTPPV